MLALALMLSTLNDSLHRVHGPILLLVYALFTGTVRLA